MFHKTPARPLPGDIRPPRRKTNGSPAPLLGRPSPRTCRRARELRSQLARAGQRAFRRRAVSRAGGRAISPGFRALSPECTSARSLSAAAAASAPRSYRSTATRTPSVLVYDPPPPPPNPRQPGWPPGVELRRRHHWAPLHSAAALNRVANQGPGRWAREAPAGTHPPRNHLAANLPLPPATCPVNDITPAATASPAGFGSTKLRLRSGSPPPCSTLSPALSLSTPPPGPSVRAGRNVSTKVKGTFPVPVTHRHAVGIPMGGPVRSEVRFRRTSPLAFRSGYYKEEAHI